MASSDIRIVQVREAQRDVKRALREAERARQRRDSLIRELRDSNPGLYTHAKLAKIIGSSEELIRHILAKPRKRSRSA